MNPPGTGAIANAWRLTGLFEKSRVSPRAVAYCQSNQIYDDSASGIETPAQLRLPGRRPAQQHVAPPVASRLDQEAPACAEPSCVSVVIRP